MDRWRRTALIACAVVLVRTVALRAHPAPFSYIDLHLDSGVIRVSLVAHAIDVAHELGDVTPEQVLDPAVAAARASAIFRLLEPRLRLSAGGRPLVATFRGLEPLPARQALRVRVEFPVADVPGVLELACALFPYDPNHQTFVNIYERSTLTHQAILDRHRTTFEYFSGTRQGLAAVVRKFLQAGIHHIAIGPDHILFLIGLLLLGGAWWQLVKIVTAFTLAHSVTLSLATLDIVSPSPRLVEPAIALSIIYVGADNLLTAEGGRDVRAWVAFAFGFIHGFGFASVLKAMDLPRRALGWSLVSFNVGVELGQLVVVLVVASLVASVRRRSARLGRRIAVGGSVAVIAAGAYWFVERVFFSGGGA